MDPANDIETVDAEGAVAPNREHEEIMRWRLSQILLLGIDQLDAELLAEAGADLGLLRRLVGQGCPPPLAARIVL